MNLPRAINITDDSYYCDGLNHSNNSKCQSRITITELDGLLESSGPYRYIDPLSKLSTNYKQLPPKLFQSTFYRFSHTLHTQHPAIPHCPLFHPPHTLPHTLQCHWKLLNNRFHAMQCYEGQHLFISFLWRHC
jgi:hypothetical protein